MDEKRKSKRIKLEEDSLWECSVCTYRNSPDAFKCDMCDVRKGTSTRKPHINPQVVAQQMSAPVVPKKEKSALTSKANLSKTGSDSQKENSSCSTVKTSKKKVAKLSTAAANSSCFVGSSIEVTVGNVTVIITDCLPGKMIHKTSGDALSSRASSPSYTASCSSDTENSVDSSSTSKHDRSFASATSSID